MPSLTFRAAFFSLFKAFEIHIVDDSLSPSNPLFTSGLCPPLPHISPSIRLPPCVLTRCVVCLFTRDVNSGMNVRVTVGVTFTASFSRKTLPPTQVCRALPPVVPPLPPDYVRVIRGLDMLYQD